jgi:hypothetical protein
LAKLEALDSMSLIVNFFATRVPNVKKTLISVSFNLSQRFVLRVNVKDGLPRN